MSITEIIKNAQILAKSASLEYLEKYGDNGSCGFAWVKIYEYNGKTIRSNSKIGKELESLGITKDYTKTFEWWNPSKISVQSVLVLEAGAKAAAEYLKENGFTAYYDSRLD